MRRYVFILLPLLLITLQAGCNNDEQKKENESSVKTPQDGGHIHGSGDALHWPKKEIEHQGYVVSLGHHGDHWHGGEQIEPAVAITKDGEDVGDAKLTCQLSDGETAIKSPVDMIFEPKTEAEPAHFAGAKLTFPSKEKKYLVLFEITFPGVEEKFTDSIEVNCGH